MANWRRPLVKAFSLAVVCLTIAGSLAAPPSQAQGSPSDISALGTLLGSEIVVSSLDVSQLEPVTAYDPVRDEYLVVWTNVRVTGLEVYARRISGDGQVLSWFYVGDGGWPSVAFNAARSEFLVVYSREDPVQGDYELYGRRVDYTGTLGSEIVVSTMPASELEPSVAHNSIDGGYLVAWVNAISSPPSGHYEVYARALDDAGQPTGTAWLVAGDPAYASLAPNLAYNAARNEYLVAYEYGSAGAMPSANTIRVWRLSPTGVVIGKPVDVSASGYHGLSPAMACTGGDRCLVAWQRWDALRWTYDVHARGVLGDGTMLAAPLEIAHTKLELEPAVADGGNGQFLVTWTQQYADYGLGIWGRYTFADGSQTSPFEIVAPSPSRNRESPALALGSRGYLVVWRHWRSDGSALGNTDIHARLVARSYRFSGYVYDYSSPTQMTGLAGVPLELHGDVDAPDSGADAQPVAVAITAADGSFALEWAPTTAYPYLLVIEFDLPGYVSTAAAASDGSPLGLNMVVYSGNPAGPQAGTPVGIYSSNQFWDAPATYSTWTFNGHVYSGNPPDTTAPTGGVTVKLYGDADEFPVEGTPSTLLSSYVTDSDGSFSVKWASLSGYPYFHLTEVDLAGTSSTGALAGAGGTVKNYNVISYHNAGPGTYDGSAFWDTAPPGTVTRSFSGHVYRGAPPNASTVIAGVTVQLLGDGDEWPVGGAPSSLLGTTVTGADGAFTLTWTSATTFPYYHVMELDLAGMVSMGALAGTGGVVKNFNVVSYPSAGAGSFTGSAFWDFPSNLPLPNADQQYLPLLMR